MKKFNLLILSIFLIFHLVFGELRFKTKINAHYFGINALEVSSSGDIVSTGGGDFNIKIWNSETFELKNTIPCHNESEGLGFNVRSLVFLKNGNLVTGSSVYYYGRETYETRIFYKLWDFKSSKMILYQNGESFDEIENMIQIKNYDLAIVTNFNRFSIRNNENLLVKKNLAPFKDCNALNSEMILLKNQDLLFGCGNNIHIYDGDSLNPKANFTLISKLNSLIVLVNGDLLTAELDDALRVWEKDTFQLKQTIKQDKITDGINKMIVLNNGDLLLGTNDGFLRLLDGETYELKQEINVVDQVLALNILTNGDLLSGSSNGTISVWSTN